MQGIELSRRFYAELVQPWLTTVAPGLPHSAALIGFGSELLGFDDETSRDHNWGPRVHIFVARDAFDRDARRLVAAFSSTTPTEFLGEPIGWRSRPHPPADGPEAVGSPEHGVEFHTLEGTLERLLGVRSTDDLSALQWLGFAEQRLLTFTAGAVFHDDGKRLTVARQHLAYFPDDVWRYKLACQWRRIAEQQAFVGRTGQVGDDLGSRLIAARLAHDAMRMAFLLGRQYAPYAKWLGSAFARLPLASDLSPHLERTLLAAGWRERGEALAAAYLVLAQHQLALGIGQFVPVIGPYFDRPFATINADDIIAATLATIADPSIRQLPVIGSLDQVTDSTPVLEDPTLWLPTMQGLLG